jgi:uncharacterized protein (DUF1330 family)
VRGKEVTPIYDSWNPERIVVIAFESVVSAQACLSSPDCQQIAAIGEQATVSAQ